MMGNHISFDLLQSVDIVIKASHDKYTKQHIITLSSRETAQGEPSPNTDGINVQIHSVASKTYMWQNHGRTELSLC